MVIPAGDKYGRRQRNTRYYFSDESNSKALSPPAASTVPGSLEHGLRGIDNENRVVRLTRSGRNNPHEASYVVSISVWTDRKPKGCQVGSIQKVQ